MTCPEFSDGVCLCDNKKNNHRLVTASGNVWDIVDSDTQSKYCLDNFDNCTAYQREKDKVAEREVAAKKAQEAKEVAERLREAAEQGNADAQFKLGNSYFTGQGEVRDYAKAAEWFRKAVAQGHGEAKDWLTKAEAAVEEEKARKARETKEAAERAEAEKAKKEAAERASEAKERFWSVFPMILGGIIGLLFMFLSFTFLYGWFAIMFIALAIAGGWYASKLFGGCLSVIIGGIIGIICSFLFFVPVSFFYDDFRAVGYITGVIVGALLGLLVRKVVNRDEGIVINVVAIIVAIVVPLIATNVYMTTGSRFKYQQNDHGTLTITGYRGKGQVVIPATNEGINVTEIGYEAFDHKGLRSVVIPDSVTTIEDSAFSYNELTSVTIPNSVTTIGKEAFGSNALTSVVIPDSITSISERMFWYNRLTSVTIPNSVTTIGYYAFRKNQLTSVIIPDSVTSIGYSAFEDNPVISVRIGANVTLGEEENYQGSFGILGKDTGFNTAYARNDKRAGTYTRPDTDSTTWTRN